MIGNTRAASSAEIQLELHAEIAAPRLGHFQPVEALARAGEHDAARHVQAARLAGDLFQLLVEIDGVLLRPSDVGIAVEGVHAAGACQVEPQVSSPRSISSTSFQPALVR